MKWLPAISGKRVALTGKAWLNRGELQEAVRRLGGIPTRGAKVTSGTTVLVRGQSRAWKYGDHGSKERRAAQLIREGHQIAVLHDSEFRKLVESGKRAKVLDRVAGQPVDWLTAASKRRFTRTADIEGPLDREHSVDGRVEQSFLRRVLLGDRDEAACSLCGQRLPVELLVAAHIKPRCECSRQERLDATNVVFGICVLGCDALYERGLISVGHGGRIRVASGTESRALKKLLRPYDRRKCSAWNEANAKYFEWHLKRRFQG